jgi:exfoliative toxin A/B
MKKLLNKIPVPISGLMLALVGAGNLTESYGTIYKNFFGIISMAALLLIIGKVIVNHKAVKEDLNNPVIASVAPTFSMGIMMLSRFLKPYAASAAYIMWIIGLLLHCALIIYFTKKFVFSFNIKKVFPSYFVVYVGIVVGSVTAPAFNAATLGRVIFWFGFAAYLILLPVVLYRVFRIKDIPEPALPTITIFAAPASLCLVGYMSSFQQKNMFIVGFLAIISTLTFFAVLIYLPKLLKLKFYPSYSAFTFPCVISATAIKVTNTFLNNSDKAVPMLKYLVRVEELIAVVIVLYVLLRYIDFLFIKKPVEVNVPAVGSN